jgi:uncharacterized caspase-like protein
MSPASNDARYALLIATDCYVDDRLANLEEAVRDADELAKVLLDEAIGNYREVTVLSNPTVQEARLATERFFGNRKPTDVLVFYFAGHAFRNEQGDELFLAVADTKKRDAPQTTSLTGHDLRSLLEHSRARRKLLLLDCCSSGALTLARGADEGEHDRAEDFSRGLSRLVPAEPEPAAFGLGTVVIGAARADERAFESQGGGLLTAAALDGLTTGAADRAHRGSVSTDDLFNYVTERLQHHPHQHPVRHETGRSGQFIIAESPWRKQVILPDELRALVESESPVERQKAVYRLRDLAGSADPLAAAARQRLQEKRDFDTDWGVKTLADRALEETRLIARRSSVDFGRVLSGTETPEAEVRVDGPPLARDWSVTTSDPGLKARRTSNDAVTIRLRPTGRGPYAATVTLDSSAGKATIQVAADVRTAPWNSVLAGAKASAARWRVPAIRLHLPWTGQRWQAAAAVIVLVLTGATVTADQASAVPWCVPRAELRVLTTESMRTAIVSAANAFVSRSGGGCRDIHVTVAGAVSDGFAREHLAKGWPDDQLRAAGPQPDVWLPESSLQVELLRADLDDPNVSTDRDRRIRLPDQAQVRGATTASSQLVLAVPSKTGWSQLGDGGRKVVRPDPDSSSSGLLATGVLHAQPGGAHKAERMLEPSQGNDLAKDLCQFRHQSDDAAVGTAYLVSRKMLREYNAGKRLGASCATDEDPPARRALQEVQLVDDPPAKWPVHLDLPCLVINSPAWGDRHQQELASRFCAFLSGEEGQKVLRQEGLDPPTMSDPSTDVPPGKLKEVLADWAEARRPWRVLLAVDVSGSMNLSMAGGRRITVATNAAGRAVDASALGPNDEIGLWQFATRLAGDRDYATVVPMGSASASQQQKVKDQLGSLRVTRQNTGLYDTVWAGVQELRNRPAPKDAGVPPVDRLIILTDGQNDDPGSISTEELAARLRQAAGVQVSVIAAAGANCRPLDALVRQGLLSCFDEVDGGLDAAFEQVLP